MGGDHKRAVFFPIDFLEDLVPIVSDWWDGKRALGQVGVNAETRRESFRRHGG